MYKGPQQSSRRCSVFTQEQLQSLKEPLNGVTWHPFKCPLLWAVGQGAKEAEKEMECANLPLHFEPWGGEEKTVGEYEAAVWGGVAAPVSSAEVEKCCGLWAHNWSPWWVSAAPVPSKITFSKQTFHNILQHLASWRCHHSYVWLRDLFAAPSGQEVNHMWVRK